MYKITEKVALNPTVTKMVIEAPLIAKKAKPGTPDFHKQHHIFLYYNDTAYHYRK